MPWEYRTVTGGMLADGVLGTHRSRSFWWSCSTLMARKNFGNDRSCRCDRFCQKIIQIGAILAIFWPFEIFTERPIMALNQFCFQKSDVVRRCGGAMNF